MQNLITSPLLYETQLWEIQLPNCVISDNISYILNPKRKTVTKKVDTAKTFAVNVAIKNAQTAVEILGGYGVTKECLAGKFIADATIGYSCDFTREILRLEIVNFL
ncbi:acyl-CoA dehydrogenase family protein [uncultured Nostoc sp.]|uniref:acyl-CoA dehydrogenase family protein n=1 Tax=uncultured Nostoc sp. TaxID=340711 RepID=UPI0035CB5A2E